MKKRVLTYLAIALLLSCTRIEVQDWEPQSLVAYNVVSSTAAQTKATTAFPTTSTFMSSAYQLNSGQSWDSDYASSTPKFGPEPEEVKYMGTYWSTDKKHFWEDGKTLTFFSYAPASLKYLGLNISKEGVSVDDWDVTNDSMKDTPILVADVAKDKVKNESSAGFTGVPTHFRHKLSKVSIRLAKSTFSKADDIYVTKLSIGNYYTMADFEKGGTDAESWTNLRNLSETVLYEDVNGMLLSDAFWVLDKVMIPQTLTANSYLTISYKSEKSGEIKDEDPVILYFMRDFRSGIWAIGTHVTYTLKVGAGMFPIQFEASARAWTLEGTTGIELS